jgi:hypothetical protein
VQQVRKVTKAKQVFVVRLVQQVYKVLLQQFQDLQVHKDQQVRKGLQECQVLRVQLDRQVRQDYKATQDQWDLLVLVLLA